MEALLANPFWESKEEKRAEEAPGTFINYLTGEVLDYSTMSTDEILEQLSDLETAYQQAKKALETAKLTVLDRMAEQDATLYENDQFKVNRVVGKQTDYNMERLLELRKHLTEEQFAKTFKVEYKPRKRELKKLAKLGGEVKEIIETSVVEKERPPRPSDLKLKAIGGDR